jgi:hypothetical protein
VTDASAEIARLTAHLAALGVVSQRKTDRLTFEIRKHRRLCKVAVEELAGHSRNVVSVERCSLNFCGMRGRHVREI